MNDQKKPNIYIEKKKSLRKNQQKTITKKSSIDNLNNLIPKKDIYQTIIINKTSSKYNSKSKK